MTRADIAWRVLAVAAAAGAAFGLRYLTAAELAVPAGASSLVRLSWSARPERVERCRRLTDDELAKRPVHMRLRLECEGSFARYHLLVSANGRVLASDTVRGGGLRHDRPMHVFREFAVPPGPLRLTVTLARIDSVGAVPDDSAVLGVSGTGGVGAETLLGAREAREMAERRQRAGEAIPARLALDTSLALGRGRVVLVTWDDEARRLAARTGR
jgi:hypothetical protein